VPRLTSMRGQRLRLRRLSAKVNDWFDNETFTGRILARTSELNGAASARDLCWLSLRLVLGTILRAQRALVVKFVNFECSVFDG
jgi:hypothetical protein